jgi:two-component sensor histidine kinase
LKGEVTSTTWLAGFYDVNSDGNDEIYFSITTGFGLFPRRLYSFDIQNNQLNGSQLAGIICQFPKMTDADNDNKPEIFGLMGASGNHKKQIPYTDWSSWFMVFNEKLEFEFPPVEFPGYPKVLEISSFRSEMVNGYVLSERVSSADTTIPESRILIYSSDGRLLQSRIYSDLGITKQIRLIVVRSGSYDRVYVLEDKIYEFDDKLSIVGTADLPFTTPYYIYQADINNDGKTEFFISSPEEEKLVVYNSEFHALAETKFKSPDQAWEFSTCISKRNTPVLYLSSANQGYFFRMIRNKYYYLGFFAYPGTYLGFFILITLTKKITTYQVIQKESLKQRLVTLQLQGIKSQLDPHFTFNTLNSIASLIYIEDRQAAYDYMRKFTQLLRTMLNDAEKIYRNLGEEIEFVTTYLELEKLRFGDKFNYEIQIGENVNKLEKVPKLVLQTFAENSVKHGIMPSETGGLIKISVKNEKDYLRITVEDNGVGRNNSAGHSNSTGKGLKLTSEFYEILNHINKKPIKLLLTDLYNSSNEPSGTRVEVWVPVDGFANLRN